MGAASRRPDSAADPTGACRQRLTRHNESMISPELAIDRIVRDPEWLAHRYDPDRDAVQFVRVPRAAHTRATFITDEYLTLDSDTVVVERNAALAAGPAVAPVHFLFHSAFCCSTLLARAVDLPGISMGLKEPVILNDIVGWRFIKPVEGARVAQTLDGALSLLGRPFEAGEALVIKPSNVTNGLADAMLALRPQSSALLLHAPLPIYLRSIAKKRIDGRLWVRDLLAKLLREGLIDLGLEGTDYLRLTDLQAAAVGWLAQHALFGRLAAKYGSRIKTLDSETLMARPVACIAALAVHYGLAIDHEMAAAIVAGPAFTSHSKDGRAFDATARTAEYRAVANEHDDELAKVEIWAAAVAETAGVPFALPAGLIEAENTTAE